MNTPHEFYHAFEQSTTIVKNLLCELYMYNLVVLDDRDWNPLMFVGEIKVREFMSWDKNEITKKTSIGHIGKKNR